MKRPSKYLLERRGHRHRQRKILNLEERVQAIHLYDQNPVYMRVASKLKCSWEQIKNVVQNRDAILAYYARCQTGSNNDKRRMMRQQKIQFLGQVMYEYVKRVSCLKGSVPDDVVIRQRALRFRSILGIPNFLPNKVWMSDFKNSYKLNFRSMDFNEIQETPLSLNCKEIIAFCRQNEKSNLAQKTVPPGNPNESVEEATTEKGYSTTSTDLEEFSNRSINQSVDEDEDEEDGSIRDDDKIVNSNAFIDFDDDADDEINENEEGPTIDFGDYEYMGEEDEEEWGGNDEEEAEERKSMESIGRRNDVTSVNSKTVQEKIPTTPQLSLLEPVEPTWKEKISTRGSQKTLPDAQLTPKQPQSLRNCKSTSSGEVNDLDVNKSTADNRNKLSSDGKEIRVDDYADALNVLGPLEEFALSQEDFRAVNLLSQLVALYRNHLKRKRRTRT